jgi:hypothetical protein
MDVKRAAPAGPQATQHSTDHSKGQERQQDKKAKKFKDVAAAIEPVTLPEATETPCFGQFCDTANVVELLRKIPKNTGKKLYKNLPKARPDLKSVNKKC